MKLNLLLVSFEDFPSDIELKIQERGIGCYYARGRLKVMEILKQEEINGIVWFHKGYSPALAADLINTFNQKNLIPVIILTTKVGEPELIKRIQSRKKLVDLNDGLREILTIIEDACLGKETATSLQTETHLPEINFRGAMRSVTGSDKERHKSKKSTSLSEPTPWSAVDTKEKNVITEPYLPPKNLILRVGKKIKQLFS